MDSAIARIDLSWITDEMDHMEKYVARERASKALRNAVVGIAGIATVAAVGSGIGKFANKMEQDKLTREYEAKNPETLKARNLLSEIDTVVKRDGWTVKMAQTVEGMILAYLSLSTSEEERAQKLGYLSGELVMNIDGISPQAKDVAQDFVLKLSRESSKKE